MQAITTAKPAPATATATAQIPKATSLTTALADTAVPSRAVTIYAQLVKTGNEWGGGVPKGQYRISDDVRSLERHHGSAVEIATDSPSVRLSGVPNGTFNALIAAERTSDPHGFGERDRDYNAAIIAVQGVLTLGKGLHDGKLKVTNIGPASWEDLKSVGPKS